MGGMPSCASCGTPYGMPVYRNTLCPSCGKELKTCRNCRHFSPGAPNDCREPVSDPVAEKDRANFCDWFVVADDAGAGASGPSAGDEARRAFDDLFSSDD